MAESRALPLEDLYNNLTTVFDQLNDTSVHRKKGGGDAFSLESFWLRFTVSVAAVSKEATSMSLAFSSEPYPEGKDVTFLTGAIESAVLSMLSSYYFLPKSQGMVLHSYIKMSVIGIVDGLRKLVKFITGQNLSDKAQLHLTGSVWEQCDLVNTLPRDNKDAILKQIQVARELVEDALTEIEESLNDVGSWETMDIDLNGCDQEDIDEKWTAKERAVLTCSVGLVRVMTNCIKKIQKSLVKNGECSVQSNISDINDLDELVQRISPVVDNYASGLYHPIDTSTAKMNAEDISDLVKNILRKAKASHYTKECDASWLDFLRTAAQHNLTKLNEAFCTQDIPTS